jgi:hypothetical protein
MLSLLLKTSKGRHIWCCSEAPEQVTAMPALWGGAIGTFRPNRGSAYLLPAWQGRDHIELEGSTIHGRSCYLGKDESGRNYFAKGTGWVFSRGWEPCHGNSGVLPRWAAERERDFALAFAALGVSVARPIAIIAHTTIPDANKSGPRLAEEVPDLNGQPARPCMYVYSSGARWRLADLHYLSDRERRRVCGDESRKWLHGLLSGLGRSCGLLHAADGYDSSLSGHNVFTDGSRVDFEYAVLPSLPHRDPVLNKDADIWRDKELDGLRQLAWETAELMRIDVPVDEVSGWCEAAYRSAFDRGQPTRRAIDTEEPDAPKTAE